MAAAVRLSPVCVKTESELTVKIICDGSAAADRLSPEPNPNNSASEDLGIYKQHDPISTYDQETEDRDVTSENQYDVILVKIKDLKSLKTCLNKFKREIVISVKLVLKKKKKNLAIA